MFSYFNLYDNDLFNDRYDKIINKTGKDMNSVFDDTKDLYKDLYDYINYDLDVGADKTTLTLAIPGFNKSEIEVTYADDILHVTATKEKETALVRNVDTEFTLKKKYSEVKAKYDAGILTITLVKQKTPASQVVTVE